MITANESYLLGILFGKGSIIVTDNGNVVLNFRVKFRRPTDGSLRTDNIHTQSEERAYVETLKSKLSNDFSEIIYLLRDTWNINSKIDLPNSYSLDDWKMKEILISTEEIPCDHQRLCELLNVEYLENNVLKKFPFHLNLENNKMNVLSFLQGICDSCSLVPNEASSSYGGDGDCRIQLEPSQERWEIPIGICKLFQVGLSIPVNNINWGHPQIRGMDVWRGQNHQFRVSLKNIPPQIELYRLSYKREEYRNLYARRNTSYEEADLCPVSKRVREGEVIHVHRTSNPEIDNDLLDERIRGISIDVSQRKSLIVCKLLGCTQCQDYFDVEIDEIDRNEN